MARPRIEIDKKNFEKLCDIQCTLDEIAGFFDCSSDTIERWCKREYKAGFADTYKKHSAGGKISLRRTQFKLAEKSAAMAIWLGKQYLDQRDTFEYVDTESTEKISRLIDAVKEI
jgi:hypothetical protein